jgi:hypothetical protein
VPEERAVDSALAQERGGIEAVVVGNGTVCRRCRMV